MWKLIFLGLLVWLVVYILRRAIKPTGSGQNKHDDVNSKSKAESVENMVQCASCQVHLPRSEAFLVDGKFYCSRAHIENQ